MTLPLKFVQMSKNPFSRMKYVARKLMMWESIDLLMDNVIYTNNGGHFDKTSIEIVVI